MPDDMLWSGWGEPAQAVKLPDGLLDLLRDALGVKGPRPAVEFDAVQIAESCLDGGARERLAAVVSDHHVDTDREARLLHTGGKSTPDLLRIRTGDATGAPDAVVLPGSHDEVLAVLRICAEDRIAVVPFGGGTSVVGGLTPADHDFAAVISLDLRRLNRLLELDEVSRTATLEPGLRGPQAEAHLNERGYTIGHHPQSFEFASLGGFAAARSSGQASAGYGRFDDGVVGLRIATPAGSLELGRAPKSGAGPDLRQLFLGSEGAFGVLTALRIELHPAPATRLYEGWRLPSFAAGAQALRALVQDGPLPTVLRLSDEAETAINLARPAEIGSGSGAGCLAITGYEGAEEEVRVRRAGASEVLRAHGGEPDPETGDAWLAGRYHGPYLRDALLDAGALVETLETATFWSNLQHLYEAVSSSVRESLTALGTPPVVLCHISHTYGSGASLYFTIAAAQLEDPVAQWAAAKRAASDAILSAGGTITHHHGVGTDHRDHYATEIGALGGEVLRAVKAALDPAGIMNPGVLIPPLSAGPEGA